MHSTYEAYMELLTTRNVLECASVLIPDDDYYYKWGSTPEGVVSNLASCDGKHIQLTLVLSRDSTLAIENYGMPLWNAVISKCKKNVEVLIAFGANSSYFYEYTKEWSEEDKEKFNTASEEMGLFEEKMLNWVF